MDEKEHFALKKKWGLIVIAILFFILFFVRVETAGSMVCDIKIKNQLLHIDVLLWSQCAYVEPDF